MIARDQQESDWIAKHTLSDEDVRQLVFEKIERAKLLQKAVKNRELEELA